MYTSEAVVNWSHSPAEIKYSRRRVNYKLRKGTNLCCQTMHSLSNIGIEIVIKLHWIAVKYRNNKDT